MEIVDGRAIAAEAAQRVFERVVATAEIAPGAPLEEVVNETVYHERIRLLRAADGDRDRSDRAFHRKVSASLAKGGHEMATTLLRAVVDRYAAEVAGHFDPRVYRLATSLLPLGLTGLLNGLSPGKALQHFPTLPNLTERVTISGQLDSLTRLSRLGTIVLAPTHSSNLDSVLMGYAIYRMGLPPFAYGAGLNLFDSALIGFFMHNLGAYTVDRTKTDPLYLELLKEYATVSLERGQHNLYFPGGTRSRSGAVEQHLKKGLLGATIAAYANGLRAGRPKPKVFIFPCTISYPLVLEAPSLIDDYLERAGKSRYIHPPQDEFDRVSAWVKFLSGLAALDLEVHLRIGRPRDPFGAAVDDSGNSCDPKGRSIDPADYLKVEGRLTTDVARDRAYSTMLGDAMAREYRCDNVALSTSVVAYAVFERLLGEEPSRDVYPLLRRLGPSNWVPKIDLLGDLERLLGELRALSEGGGIVLSEEVRGDPSQVLVHGLRAFASYHPTPVLALRADRVHIGDANLLLFYRNRLDGYGLMGGRALIPAREP